MRPSPRVRCAALACCALTTSTTALVAASATAQSDAQTPSATTAAPTTKRERLNVRVGQTAVVTGDAAAGRTVVLQRRGQRGWRTIDRTMTDATGHYRLRHRPREAASARVRRPRRRHVRDPVPRSSERLPPHVRVLVRARSVRQRAGLWWDADGPGTRGGEQVAALRHDLTLRYHGRRQVRVVDRGPFVAPREFDLTSA